MTAVLGLDLGGTVLKAAVVDRDGSVTGFVTAPSAEGAGVDAWIAAALAAARDALGATDATARAVGLSVPGAVDPSSGMLVDLVDRLDVGPGVSLPDAFAPLGLPVYADNDARAALAAERLFGAAIGLDNVVLLTLGTGLGGAAVVHGRAAGGEAVLAGSQFGHIIVELDGVACVCGNRGCAETFASATGLMRLATDAGLNAATPVDIFGAARAGDATAAVVVDRFAVALTAVIVNAVHAYQPDMVVLAGGLMGSADHFLPVVQLRVAELAWTVPRGRVRVEPSALRDHIGVLGAAAVAFAQHESVGIDPAITPPRSRRAS